MNLKKPRYNNQVLVANIGNYRQRIAALVKEERCRREMSVGELASSIGVSAYHVMRVEDGRSCSLQQIALIAAYFEKELRIDFVERSSASLFF